jgi:predicted nuclease of predicted toxin-antitoxin system
MKYQIVADESVDFRIVVQLREIGLAVYSIAELQPSIKDENVLAIACEHEALLITEDKDFGELIFRLQLSHRGVLLIRILEAEYKIASVVRTINKYHVELLNKFSVINDKKLRIKE